MNTYATRSAHHECSSNWRNLVGDEIKLAQDAAALVDGSLQNRASHAIALKRSIQALS